MTSKWIGESEKMVRALFAVAKSRQPSIIFIDEIDALLSARTDDKDQMRGLKTEFLVQLDGMASEVDDHILVIAATNRPNLLDEAARRRFTRRIYVGLPDAVARDALLSRLLQEEQHTIGTDELHHLAKTTEGYSCSDLTELVRSAAAMSMRGLGEDIQHIHTLPPINANDFENALNEVGRSVSHKDIAFHLTWNQEFGSYKEQDATPCPDK